MTEFIALCIVSAFPVSDGILLNMEDPWNDNSPSIVSVADYEWIKSKGIAQCPKGNPSRTK
jgi:hypothetical protein